MKKLFALMLAFGIAQAVQAAPPTTESIEKVLVLMQAEKMLDSIMPQLENMAKASMVRATQGKTPSPDEQKILDNFRAKSLAIMKTKMTMETLKPLYVDIYGKNFTQEEIDGLIAFYSSPAGKAYLTKLPAVMQSLLADMPKLMAPMVQEMQKAAEDMAAELKALRQAQSK